MFTYISVEISARTAFKFEFEPKVLYEIHKSPPFVLIFEESKFSPYTPIIFLEANFKIIFHLRLNLPSELFPSEIRNFVTNTNSIQEGIQNRFDSGNAS